MGWLLWEVGYYSQSVTSRFSDGSMDGAPASGSSPGPGEAEELAPPLCSRPPLEGGGREKSGAVPGLPPDPPPTMGGGRPCCRGGI